MTSRAPSLPKVGSELLLPTVAGAVAALIVLLLGLPGVAALLAGLAFVWMSRDPFRLFLALIVTWPIATLYLKLAAPPGVPDLRYERILILFLVGALLIQHLIGNRELPAPAPAVVVFLVVQAFLHVGRPWATSSIEPDLVTFLNASLIPVLMYWLTKAFVRSDRELRWLILSLALGAVVVAATGFYERAIDAVESPFPVNTGTSEGTRYLGVPGGRAAGVLGNPALYGAVLGMGLLAGLSLYVQAERWPARVASGAVSLVLGYGVLVSFTRSAWLAVLVAAAAAPVFMRRLRRGTARVVVIGVVVVAGVAPEIIDNLANNAIVEARVFESQNVSGRLDRMTYSFTKFTESPFIGWGSGALDGLMAEDFAESGSGFDSSHNTYLTLLVDGGALTFASFAWLIAFWGTLARQAARLHRRDDLASSAIGVVVGMGLIFLISGAFLELKFFAYFNSLFFIAGALVEVLSNPSGRPGPVPIAGSSSDVASTP